MLPKSSKHYIVPAAEELDMNPQLVEDVVTFYYRTVRKALSDLKCHFIQVENLGSFNAKANQLPKLIAKYQNHLKVLKPETFQQMTLKKDIEARMEKVISLQNMIKADRQRKKEFLEKKYGNIRTNMASKKTDS